MKLHRKNVINISLYLIISILMFWAVSVADKNILKFSTENNSDDKAAIDVILVSNSLFVSLAVFSLLALYITYKSKNISVYDSQNRNIFIACNLIILAFTINIFLPGIAFVIALGSGEFALTLILGSLLALCTSVVNILSLI